MPADRKHSIGVTDRFLQAMKQIVFDEEMTITVFAVSVGTFQSNISLIESGKRYATVDMICDMCLKYDINPAWILLNQGEMKKHNEAFNLGSMMNRLNEIEKQLNKRDAKPKRKVG